MNFEEWWNEKEPVYSDENMPHFGFDNPDDKKIIQWVWDEAQKQVKERVGNEN